MLLVDTEGRLGGDRGQCPGSDKETRSCNKHACGAGRDLGLYVSVAGWRPMAE